MPLYFSAHYLMVDEGYFWACIVANLIVCARIPLFLYKQGQPMVGLEHQHALSRVMKLVLAT